MDTIPPAVAERQAQQDAEDGATRIAAGKALPGPTAQAFNPQPEITVGPFKVRPFVDADFETLQILGNPLQEMVSLALAGQKSEVQVEKIIPKVSRGQHAWDICFVQTTPPDEIDEILASGGAAALKKASRKAFGNKYNSMLIVSLVMAAIEQMNKSWSTMLAFGPAEKNGEGASGAPNP